LEKSASFVTRPNKVPVGESAFNYVDTVCCSNVSTRRCDRFLMGAAFSPALGKNVDPAKIPPPEAITKHLSPIVMSQRYEKEGYVTESLGPVTFRAATIGLIGAIGVLYVDLQERFKGGGLLPAGPANPSPSPAATASPSPSPSPF
jgi:hypothetical protein